ncbi:MAG: cell envelope integrity protein TolA [Alphaproteobacteria bacterium]
MKKHFSFIKFDNAVELIPPLLMDGLVISFIVHIFILVLIMISPHIHIKSSIPKLKYDEPIIIDLENVVIGKKTVLPPAPAKVNPKPTKEETPKTSSVSSKETTHFAPEVAKPTEEKVEKHQNEDVKSDNDFITEKKEEKKETPPKNDKDLASERIGSINDLLASVDGIKRDNEKVKEKELEKLNKKEEFVEVKKGISASSIDTQTQNYQANSTADYLKKQLAVSYIDAIRIKLRSCWNIDPGAKDIKNMKIVIRTTISPDGNINNIDILNLNENNSSWFKAVAESAKRALIVCSPYHLPVEYYNDWKSIVFTFYPDKQSVQ